MIRRPPRSPLFPSPPLSRSGGAPPRPRPPAPRRAATPPRRSADRGRGPASLPLQASRAFGERATQQRTVRHAGPQRHPVDARLDQLARALLQVPRGGDAPPPPSRPRTGADQDAPAVAVARRGERQDGGGLDGERRLGGRAPEVARARLVDDEEQGDLALFMEGLHEGVSHARRHVPIDGAEIVALLVGADLGELDPLAAKHGAVFAREQRVDEGAGAQLDPLDLAQHLGSDAAPAGVQRRRLRAPAVSAVVPHGTPTASRILAITRSASMSSASASKVRSTRCRNTSKAIALTSSGTT